MDSSFYFLFVICIIAICLTIYKVYFKETIIEGNWFKRTFKKAKKTIRQIDPTKIIKDSINKVSNFFKTIFHNFTKPVTQIFNGMTNEIKYINGRLQALPNSIDNIFATINNDLNQILNDLKNVITAPMNGIDTMITNFKRLMCFFETIPGRIDLIITGTQNIFEGIDEQYKLIIKAAGLGLSSTNQLLNVSVIYINSYLKCALKLIKNLYKCAFYYMIDAFGKLLFLPIKIIFFLLHAIFNIDTDMIENNIWKGMQYIDSIFYSILHFHIIYFPKHIRDDCYTCISLRDKVVKTHSNNVNKTFNTDIPNLFNRDDDYGANKIYRGKRQFEASKTMPKAPSHNSVK